MWFHPDKEFYPINTSLFGAVLWSVSTNHIPENLTLFQHYNIRAKTLDRLNIGSTKCNEKAETNVVECLQNYIVSKMNCNITLNSSISNRCTSREQLDEYLKLTLDLSHASENELIKMTGCKAKCLTEDYTTLKTSEGFISTQEWFGSGFPDAIILHFISDSAKVDIVKDVLIYDINNLWADIGGIMGLLLGISILSIIQFGEELIYKHLNAKKKISDM